MNHDLDDKSDLCRAFIFECLSARLNGSELNAAIDLAQRSAFDWELLLQVADEELVSPLLHEIVQGKQIAPRAVEEALARKHQYIARRNLFLLHQLAKIVTLLQETGIETIVLKGAALAETVYQDIALRPMRDLDLLIQYEKQPAALELLIAAGFEETSATMRDSYEIILKKPGIEPIFLELHWSLFHSLYYQHQLSMAWFWQTVNSVKSTAQPMLILGDEAQILHLCGHLTLHHTHQSQLLWCNDLAELIFRKKEKIRWDLLINKAQTFQLILPLRHILLPLAREWGAPVPAEVLQELQSSVVSEEEREAFALSTAVKQSEGEGYWFRLKEIRGWRRRLVYVMKWFFPAPAVLRARYKVSRPWLVPLAYPIHWLMGVRLGIEALLTRNRKDASSG